MRALGVHSPDVLTVLRRRPEWEPAASKLRDLVARHGDEARRRAEDYGRFYQGRRGSMVLDVVTSRQRRYQNRVLPLVAQWDADNDEHSLRWLSTHEPVRERYGLRPGEPNTTVTVARNMVAFADDLEVSEDQACRQWADDVAGLEHAPRLDPVAGAVPGIGPALFAYLRMRSGSDALKPDLRVAKSLRQLGFHTPSGEHAILVVAHAAAAEVAIGLLVLDQLLWWLDRT
jgi:hypothetical protein